MARAAGLAMPRTELIKAKVNGKQEAFFAVQRFDRDHNRKIHFLSLSGYTYANHRAPSLDYLDGVMPAVRKLMRSAAEAQEAFRLMVFNVLAHNKDDHAKNFAFLRDPQKDVWELAPAFDLTFNHGMKDNHTTSVNGAGQPTAADIKAVADRHGIKSWKMIVEEVRGAVAQWPGFADEFGLTKARTQEIQKALQTIDAVCRV